MKSTLIIDRTGEIRQNHFGTPMKIISYRNCDDIDVEFQDEHHFIVKHATYNNFKLGGITNPYDITVYGVGYFGEGKYKSSYEKGVVYQGYKTWADMLKRCYRTKYKDMYPSYHKIATVCDEWHCYQVFAEWYENNKYNVEERLHLDKDILIPGNKIYSPETCILVPQRINLLFMNKSNSQGLPNGIRKMKSGYYSVHYSHLKIGNYKTFEEAANAYCIAKENAIKDIADEYKNIIPTKLYDALNNYKVDITLDKNYVA